MATILTRPTTCPRCNSTRIAGPLIDAELASVWFECEECRHFWALSQGWTSDREYQRSVVNEGLLHDQSRSDHGQQMYAPWRNLNELVSVCPSSEASGFGVAGPLSSPPEGEWRASHGGAQVIRLRFDVPQHLTHIRLVFRDDEQTRTQEFTLRWLPAGEDDFHDIVRQQFNFDPRGATEEIEEYLTPLEHVAALELRIVPDIGGGFAQARLSEWRIA